MKLKYFTIAQYIPETKVKYFEKVTSVEIPKTMFFDREIPFIKIRSTLTHKHRVITGQKWIEQLCNR